MYLGTLKLLMKVRGLNMSEVARLAGVSRQAVSLWLKSSSFGQSEDGQAWLQLRAKSLLNLARNLNLPVDSLLLEVPSGGSRVSLIDLERELNTEFNWDRLYPSWWDFLAALLVKEQRAVARLVQCVGLFEAAALLGPVVWRRFPSYKRLIHPVSRSQCESIWNIQESLGLI